MKWGVVYSTTIGDSLGETVISEKVMQYSDFLNLETFEYRENILRTIR